MTSGKPSSAAEGSAPRVFTYVIAFSSENEPTLERLQLRLKAINHVGPSWVRFNRDLYFLKTSVSAEDLYKQIFGAILEEESLLIVPVAQKLAIGWNELWFWNWFSSNSETGELAVAGPDNTMQRELQ